MKTFLQTARKESDSFDESYSTLADTAVFQLLKIPPEMEVAPRFTLLSLLTLFDTVSPFILGAHSSSMEVYHNFNVLLIQK